MSLVAALAAGYAAFSSGCGGSSPSTIDAAIVAADAAPEPPDAATPEPPDAAAPGPDAAPQLLWQTVTASALPCPVRADGLACAPADPPTTFASTTTFREPFTVMRTGTRVEVTLWGSNGDMVVGSAWIGRDLGSGTVDSNTQLLFGGKPNVTIPAGTTMTSDPLDFAVTSGERYAVSFAASGSVPRAQSDIGFEGMQAPGDHAGAASLNGTRDPAFRGVKWVAVLGPQQRAVSVLGDSIAAGEASYGVDKRFIDLAQLALGYPVVDSAEGADGVVTASTRIDRDVLALPGVTDCLVELGTNDLWQANPEKMGLDAGTQYVIDSLTSVYTKLGGAGLKVWGATILPKGPGVLTANGEAARVKVNQFIQSTNLVSGVVDFAAAIADPTDPSKPAAGMLAQDGIHPLNQGHRAMADAMVKAFGGSVADAGTPDAGARDAGH
ncbi:MAG TPA: GDSL-type esterase/lipase family protein [Myxococcales bacterium]